MNIEYHPELENELREIIGYYNGCVQGLGIDFLDAFEHQVLKIASAPTLWMVIEGDIRCALIKRFPYVIYFRILKGDILRIIVIKHQRRHPNLGRKRK